MKEIKIDRTITETVFVANDGKEFSNKEFCRLHDIEINSGKPLCFVKEIESDLSEFYVDSKKRLCNNDDYYTPFIWSSETGDNYPISNDLFDMIARCLNNAYNSYDPEYNPKQTIKSVLIESGLYDLELLYNENGGEWIMTDRKTPISNYKKSVWRNVFELWDNQKETAFAMAMNLLTFHEWKVKQLCGCCQGECRMIVYDSNMISETDLDNYECELFNMGFYVEIHDSDKIIDSASDIDGYITYIHNGWNTEKIRDEICCNIGCDNSALVYIDSGNNIDLPPELME